MSNENRDLIVLGAGPGGYMAAIRAAQLGRKVSIIEREALGGVCLNWGCIPTKALLTSAKLLHQIKNSSQFGLSTDGVKVDFPAIIARSRTVAERLSAGVKFLMKKNQVEVLNGNGVLEGQNKISVQSSDGSVKQYSYKDII
ncbi:MAG: FAD-dependent oxidoreductase, partial [Deltaproteobacteria bacterium]|nr:FAD-dependent oxidoreductase [Deltaproteobacteria bacterium]